MSLASPSDRLPISHMRPKTHAEPLEFSFDEVEFDPLPEGAFVVLQNVCIIAPLKAAEKTKGGIILAATSREAEEYLVQYGRIEAVGEFFYAYGSLGESTHKPQVGDFVKYKPYSGHRFQVWCPDPGEEGKGGWVTFIEMQDKDITQIIKRKELGYKGFA